VILSFKNVVKFETGKLNQTAFHLRLFHLHEQ
jgi:hypothetical protein